VNWREGTGALVHKTREVENATFRVWCLIVIWSMDFYSGIFRMAVLVGNGCKKFNIKLKEDIEFHITIFCKVDK
jgi:hypothetical protein